MCQATVTKDLNMCRVSAKFVPCFLTIKQKEHRLSVATDFLQEAEMNQNFMEGIITGDKTLVYGYDLEIKCQSLQWKLPESLRPKKER